MFSLHLQIILDPNLGGILIIGIMEKRPTESEETHQSKFYFLFFLCICYVLFNETIINNV